VIDEVTWLEASKGINARNFNTFFPPENFHELVRILTVIGLLPERGNRPPCKACSNPQMRVINEGVIGFTYRCWRINTRNRRRCQERLSPLQNTWFENTHLNLSDALFLTYCFVNGFTAKRCHEETSISERMVIDWYSFCREVCVDSMMREESNHKIGGPGQTVEIDEAHIAKRKYSRGRVLISEHYWILGMICRETRESRLVRVDNRDRETLFPIIQQHVECGSNIMTDGAAVYRTIRTLGYASHNFVIHKYYFVDPQDREIHSNTIERHWRSLKDSLPGKRMDKIDIYVVEFMYREKFFKAPYDASIPKAKRANFMETSKQANSICRRQFAPVLT
jgi:hypothetical protein